MSGYSRLRVEEGPPQRDALAVMAPPETPTTPARQVSFVSDVQRLKAELDAARKDGIYWQAECKRVIREREQLKTAIASDSAAGYFRGEWRKANTALNTERTARQRLQKELDQAREACATFTEARDRLQRTLAELKRVLWEVWSGLADENPLRRQLWSIWSEL